MKKNAKKERREILVFKEKHGNRYFIVDSKDIREKIAVKIVADRLKEGWYLKPEQEFNGDLNSLAQELQTLQEDLKHCKSESTTKSVQDEIKKRERTLREYENDKMWWDLIQKGAKGDVKAAWNVLNYRREYEYEGFEIEYEDFISGG